MDVLQSTHRIKYLGHITNGGMLPNNDEVKAVQEMATPKTKHNLSMFLPNASEVDAPLREMLCKTVVTSLSKGALTGSGIFLP
ncbi:unnamed protein product [Lampetra planeri]